VHNLAEVLRSQGKYDEAEKMHRQALEGYEKALSKEHPHTLVSASSLLKVHEQRLRGNQDEWLGQDGNSLKLPKIPGSSTETSNAQSIEQCAARSEVIL
jgi:hypothetical protein